MEEDSSKKDVLHTKIWQEVAQEDNPFAARSCYCSGYDVYEDILPQASWFEYVYLLFKLDKPNQWQTSLLEKVAIAIANPGIRDHSVRAAMNAGVGGSTAASSLMAALAVGAGQLGGAREVYSAVNLWKSCQHDLSLWQHQLVNFEKKEVDGWPAKEHAPGFDPNGVTCTQPVLKTLSLCADIKQATNLNWLQSNRAELEKIANAPLAMSGVISAALSDLGFDAEQSEVLYLILRLPGAAVHALEQKEMGWKKYPFYLDKFHIDQAG